MFYAFFVCLSFVCFNFCLRISIMIKGVVAVPIKAKQNTRVQADLNFLGQEKYAMVLVIVDDEKFHEGNKCLSQPTEWGNAFFKHLLEEEWELFEGPGGHSQVCQSSTIRCNNIIFLHDVKVN